RLEANGLTPNPPADRRTLIRRAYFDLIGLPPTPDEVAAFVHDPDQDAYAKLIDRLLASPHYGERWGRHWLDVARLGESAGSDPDARLLPAGRQLHRRRAGQRQCAARPGRRPPRPGAVRGPARPARRRPPALRGRSGPPAGVSAPRILRPAARGAAVAGAGGEG